jgi:hypothetical protein
MCGATDQQKDLETQQAAFYKQMTAQYTQVFDKQQAILSALTDIYKPILAKGPGQRGFSDAERTDLDTRATESVATNFANAKRTLNEDLAARGGSDFIPSGGDVQANANLDATAAGERASLENQIDTQDYETGRQNFITATNALSGEAAMLNPAGFSEAATGAGGAASKTANDIAAADNSVWNSVIGGIGGIAGAAVGGWTSGLGKGVSKAASAGVPA